jgi:hypothetical protein
VAHSIRRWIDDQYVPGASCGRDDQVVLRTAEHATRLGAVFDRGYMGEGYSIDDFDSAACEVCHEQVTAWLVEISVVKSARVPVRRHRNLRQEAHAHVSGYQLL